MRQMFELLCLAVSCTTGCGGNKPVDPLALWIPGGCDIFNSFIEYRHNESKRFKKNAVEKLWRMVGEYYKELVEALVKQGHQGIVDIVKSVSNSMSVLLSVYFCM